MSEWHELKPKNVMRLNLTHTLNHNLNALSLSCLRDRKDD